MSPPGEKRTTLGFWVDLVVTALIFYWLLGLVGALVALFICYCLIAGNPYLHRHYSELASSPEGRQYIAAGKVFINHSIIIFLVWMSYGATLGLSHEYLPSLYDFFIGFFDPIVSPLKDYIPKVAVVRKWLLLAKHGDRIEFAEHAIVMTHFSFIPLLMLMVWQLKKIFPLWAGKGRGDLPSKWRLWGVLARLSICLILLYYVFWDWEVTYGSVICVDVDATRIMTGVLHRIQCISNDFFLISEMTSIMLMTCLLYFVCNSGWIIFRTIRR